MIVMQCINDGESSGRAKQDILQEKKMMERQSVVKYKVSSLQQLQITNYLQLVTGLRPSQIEERDDFEVPSYKQFERPQTRTNLSFNSIEMLK